MKDSEFYTDLDKTFSYIESLLKQYSSQTNSYLHTPSLITTRLNKCPTARTVVLRDFDVEERCLYFFTDSRSKKIKEIQHSSLGQLHFYSYEHALQMRIDCNLKLLDDKDKIKQFWDKTEVHSKIIYQQKVVSGQEIKSPVLDKLASNDIENGFQYFIVVQATIQSIDCLYLHSEQHFRSYFEWQEGQRRSSWLAP